MCELSLTWRVQRSGQRGEDDHLEKIQRGGRQHHLSHTGLQHQNAGAQRVTRTLAQTRAHARCFDTHVSLKKTNLVKEKFQRWSI